MKKLILLVFIIFLPFVGADELYSSSSLNLSVNIGSSLYIEPESENYKIEYANINLGFVPMQTDSQKILSFKTDPTALNLSNSKLFQWEEVRTRKLSFGLESFLTSNYDFSKVEDKVSFPINDIDDDISKYLDETNSIDINREIEDIAHKLVEGEDDLFRVIHNFGVWIDENLEYDLSATPTGGTHKASWVLDNKVGVCGEFTNLFIAFCRATGIPARFVSGIAYSTDPRMPDEWSPHAWAEVYFPGKGWVPVDVTFREIGYVNPARVVIMKDFDSRNPGTSYDWSVNNASVTTRPLKLNVSVENISKPVESFLDIDSSVAYREVSFGSYNVLNVNVRNKNDFYVPTELRISRSKQIDLLDGQRKLVLMEPFSEKNFYFLFNVTEDIEKDYKYNFRISAATKRNATSLASFTVGDEFSFYSKNRATDYIEDRRKEGTKRYSRNIFFNCNADKKNYLLTENVKVVCEIKNKGDLDLMDAEVCVQDLCSYKDIKSGEEKEAVFYHTLFQTGDVRLRATLEHMDALKYDTTSVSSFERPKLKIDGMDAPKNVSFNKPFTIKFLVKRENMAPVKKTTVKVEGGGISQKWIDEGFEKDGKYIINVNKHVLNNFENTINFSFEYKDAKNRNFLEEKQINISVVNMTTTQKGIMLVNRTQENIKNNWPVYVFVLIGSVIVAVLLLRYILKPIRPGSKTL